MLLIKDMVYNMKESVAQKILACLIINCDTHTFESSCDGNEIKGNASNGSGTQHQGAGDARNHKHPRTLSGD